METKFNFKSILQVWEDYKVLFVFNDDGRVSCRLSFYDDTPQDAVISDLYVHESIRKQGGATAILNWCYECAKDNKCNSVSLRSDNDDWIREWYWGSWGNSMELDDTMYPEVTFENSPMEVELVIKK